MNLAGDAGSCPIHVLNSKKELKGGDSKVLDMIRNDSKWMFTAQLTSFTYEAAYSWLGTCRA